MKNIEINFVQKKGIAEFNTRRRVINLVAALQKLRSEGLNTYWHEGFPNAIFIQQKFGQRHITFTLFANGKVNFNSAFSVKKCQIVRFLYIIRAYIVPNCLI